MISDDDLRMEAARTIAMLHAAEVEAATQGHACMAGALAGGRHMVSFLAGKLFPAPAAEPEKPADAPP